MKEKRMAPVGASIQAHKDRVFSSDTQPLPCFGCLKWCFCGSFTWTECSRFRLYLHKRKEAVK